ncbi:hypothetical protein PIB30_097604 [Stylosanthes scabra]|uniref:GRF-type domain-containing protein n=1 Tax=Stylosanthes scabra TaxID=79078 RepID=A0ABU6QVP9_9FABA|nr:hypothetical protein [Stylosanthes scabra]
MGFYTSDPKKIYLPQPNRGTSSSYFRFHSSLGLTAVTCRNKPFFKTLVRQFPTEVYALASLLRQSRKHNSFSSSRYPSAGPNLAFAVLPRFHHPLWKPISARSSVSIGSATSTLRSIAPWVTRCKKSSNESTGSGDSASGSDHVCHCGLKATLKVSHSYANSGWEYYSCPARRCKWFKWAGPPIHGASSIGPQTTE